ncbi:MAG: hypothetical protein K940chlam9_01817 [Chlamydiae bacterium]|nr:hypothetical protein [Chlamydiota bacterium]
MATKKEVNEHLKVALDEVGKIKPWFDRSVKEWIFSHPLYPVEYAGASKEEVMENYPKYLREFIKHRLNQKVDHFIEKTTKGRGGKRPGAGRPRGTRRTEETKTIRLKVYIANWIKKHEQELEGVICGEKKIVPAKFEDERVYSSKP